MAGEIDRSWHPNFVDYTEFIVSHPIYSGLYYERGVDNRVKWVVTGKSKNGKKRQAWWDQKCRELGIPIQKGCYAIAARRIHPTKKHVCQICGREMSILYEYPTKTTSRALSKLLNVSYDDIRLHTLRDIVNEHSSQIELEKIARYFKVPSPQSKEQLINLLYKLYVDTNSRKLSPGVMSNPPDRFDGFHSDGLCCREKTDTGRHDDNMKTYNQDRRAYEEWSDGDINLANRLMGEFRKCKKLYVCPKCDKLKKMSADHIGPISLGFCHSIYNFAPLCESCNSAKNNRFYADDVKKLIKLENEGRTIISWHSKYIWDKLKHQISNDEDSKRLSDVMATSHQNVLKLFAIINESSQYGADFLKRYLHPENCMYDYRFEEFDPFDLSKLKIIRKSLDSRNKRKNQERYIRVAFEALEQFGLKDNRRKFSYIDDERFSRAKQLIITAVNNQQYDQADRLLRCLVDKLQEYIITKEY